jgi:hypothetical protein
MEQPMPLPDRTFNRAAAVAVSALMLFGFPASAGADQTTLKGLYEGHQWFELRNQISKEGASAFYRGAVACAFNAPPRCQRELLTVIGAAPRSDGAIEAHRLLASAYFAHGRYSDALAQLDAIIAVRSTDRDALSDRPLLAVLAEFPDQRIHPGHTTVKLALGAVPLSINGIQATYSFDTGADLSVMTEEEARRFGLEIRPAPLKAHDVSGQAFDYRIAVANELSIGSVQLTHVAFLVVPDSRPPFNGLAAGSRGLLGLPVLLALRRFSWDADNTFEITSISPTHRTSHPNLCLDGKHPVAEIRYEHRNLLFTLDTGSVSTDLYPPFAAAFPELVRPAMKSQSYEVEGVGGVTKMSAIPLHPLRFAVGGVPVILKSASVWGKSTTASSRIFAGNLGMDILRQARKTTVDFGEMTITLQ